jgi:hypothetical protein
MADQANAYSEAIEHDKVPDESCVPRNSFIFWPG